MVLLHKIQVLRHHFGVVRIISRKIPTDWPPRFPDMNFCDFWPWSYLKAMVYSDFIIYPSDLKERIECHVCIIPQFMLLSTVDHAILRF